jgi:hypothetical protein
MTPCLRPNVAPAAVPMGDSTDEEKSLSPMLVTSGGAPKEPVASGCKRASVRFILFTTRNSQQCLVPCEAIES